MAIISCPSCKKNISSHSKLCTYCGFQMGEAAEEELREFQRRKLRDRIYHLKMSSYAALTLLIAAFGWYLSDTQGFQFRASAGPYILFAVGAVCYMVIRLFLYQSKAALKKMNM